MPSNLAAHKARDLFIFLNCRSGPHHDQESKGHEPCGSPSTAPQHLNPWPQPHKLPLALAKSNSPSNGHCHNTALAHAEPTPGPY
ncbi:hypothetical protein PS1_022396 [Malus domestica]